jgi:HTH-type transcriptional regulator/antitoxin MqsA
MSYEESSKCPICGNATLSKRVYEELIEYKGEKCAISDYAVLACSVCGEEIVSRHSLKRAQKIIVDFHRKVDGLLTSSEIKQIRSRLGYTQKQMGTLFGGGEKSFARYENATLKQSHGYGS